MSSRVILIFLDGVGLGTTTPTNPFSRVEQPFLEHLLGGGLVKESAIDTPTLLLRPLDACLGVPGTPQSATGQTALLTGVNAAAALGYHLPAFPNDKLVDIIHRHSILKQVVGRGKRATFANAYSKDYFLLVERGERAHSVTTHCVLASGTRFRTIDDLRIGAALTWDIDRRHFAQRYSDMCCIAPGEAGRHLAGLATENDLVLYESFLPDLVGHRGDDAETHEVVAMLDELIRGTVEHLPPETTLVISSDHGNIEDQRSAGHTTNPVPLLCMGPDAHCFASLTSIAEVTTAILSVLDS